MAASPLAAIGKMTELRQRILFVLGAMVVFRVGTHIPIPGVDPTAVAALFEQTRGSIVDIFNIVFGRSARALVNLCPWGNAIYFSIDHYSDDDLRRSTT